MGHKDWWQKRYDCVLSKVEIMVCTDPWEAHELAHQHTNVLQQTHTFTCDYDHSDMDVM